MRRLIILILLTLSACSRESSEPPAPSPSRAASGTAASTAESVPTTTAVKEVTYDDAVVWLKTTPRFAFVLDEAGWHAEGEMTRSRVGSEVVQFRADGGEWRGAAIRQGLVWKKRSGDAWIDAPPPPFAGRLYQRVTLGLDPEKKEGSAQLVSRTGGITLFRFTDANSGEVHQLHVRSDNSVERITIGQTVDLKITR